MRRWFVLLLVLALPAHAQDAGPKPRVTVDVAETQAIPGQPLTVRITVLVPTYMPQPPVWPVYEAPNLLVRLPEKSTSPVSELIGGETWSGISRRYQISPMVPGEFALPEAEVLVTWADPDSNAPIKTALATQAVTLTGILPEGAEGLDPFIAAKALTLDQQLQGTPDAMTPGDSVIRTVTATIEGTSPMFLPGLLGQTGAQVPGLRVYPDEPVLEIRDNRGQLSGTRTERVTYLAQGGGSGQVPGVTLEWYNLDSGQVETATLDGFAVQIDGPPATSAGERARRVSPAMVAAVAGLAVVLAVLRALWPRLQRGRARRRAAWLSSERYGWQQVERAVRAQDYGALQGALDLWDSRLPGSGPGLRADPAVSAALLALGQGRYGPTGTAGKAGWQSLSGALDAYRAARRAMGKVAPALPALNG